MSKYTKWLIGGIALCVSLLLVASSSFAATALTDEELDETTAAGQSAVQKNGDCDECSSQTINDRAQASVTILNQAQEETTAGNLINVAGENNVAGAVNLADTDGGMIDQLNDITQSKAATVVQMDGVSSRTETETSLDLTDTVDTTLSTSGQGSSWAISSASSSRSASLDVIADLATTETESCPDGVTVDIIGTVDAHANADAKTTWAADDDSY
jgi:hypothetical protein